MYVGLERKQENQRTKSRPARAHANECTRKERKPEGRQRERKRVDS